jgi:hypothetical protein
MRSKTERSIQVENFKEIVNDLLEKGKKNNNKNLFDTFKNKLLEIYGDIRQSESAKSFSCFHKSSNLGDFMEKFMKHELKMVVPHKSRKENFGENSRRRY